MTRSEERLDVGTAATEAGRARLRKYIVSERETVTVPVSHEEVRVEREPITDANAGNAYDGPALSEEEHEVVLHAETPVVNKETVPVERVRLDTETVTSQERVSEDVRKEQIEMEGDGVYPEGTSGTRSDVDSRPHPLVRTHAPGPSSSRRAGPRRVYRSGGRGGDRLREDELGGQARARRGGGDVVPLRRAVDEAAVEERALDAYRLAEHVDDVLGAVQRRLRHARWSAGRWPRSPSARRRARRRAGRSGRAPTGCAPAGPSS